MANTKSAKKSIRKEAKNSVKNLKRKRALKESRKDVLKASATGDKAATAAALQAFYKQVDKAAKKNGPLHKNTASRYKSRLTKQVNALLA